MNKLLERQIKKHFGGIDTVPQNCLALFGAISEAYDSFDKDLRLIERALDISSDELRQSNIALCEEIANRKKAEENIQKSRMILQQIIDSMPFGVLVVGKDKIIRQANIVAQKLSGYYENELLGHLCHKTLCPAEENKCPILDQKQVVDNSERKCIAKDKKIIPIIKSVIPLKLGDEDVLLETFIDITDRKKAEAALKESEERHKAIYETSRDAIMLLTPEKGFLRGNPAALKLFGCENENIFTSQTPASLSPEYQPDGIASFLKAQQINEVALEKGSHSFEWMHKRLDGSEFLANVTLTKMELQGQRVLQARAIDITEQRLAEKKQAELLEQVEKINQELNSFAYIISHDLKAPLRGIKTLSDWLISDYADKLDDNGKEQLYLLSSRVSRMHNLIDGVLQYSRIGRIREAHQQLDLNELVGEIIDMVSSPEHIKIVIENNLPTIRFEKTRIMQVFQNLLSNAIKYMDKPQGLIKVACVEDGNFWKFSVSDNGPGIEEKYFEKIFQIFQTLAPKDSYESTGIGLTIVKKIVEFYGGRVWLESVPKEGTTFFFTLLKQETDITNAQYQTNNAG